MLHTRRVWSVAEEPAIGELARKLTEYTWCLCNGFRIGDYVFLNDSTSEDALQEYAVCRKDGPTHYKQIESITVSWMGRHKLIRFIQNCINGDYDDAFYYGRVPMTRLQPTEEHRSCQLCG